MSAATARRIGDLLERSTIARPRSHRRRAGAQSELPLAWSAGAADLGRAVIVRCNSPSCSSTASGTLPIPRRHRGRGRGLPALLHRGQRRSPARQRRVRRQRRARCALSTPPATAMPGRPLSSSTSSTTRSAPSLPPPQAELEADYRDELQADLRDRFNRLLTITNMPIKRFADELDRHGRTDDYMDLLVKGFRPRQRRWPHVPRARQRRLDRPPPRLRLQPDAGPPARSGRAIPTPHHLGHRLPRQPSPTSASAPRPTASAAPPAPVELQRRPDVAVRRRRSRLQSPRCGVPVRGASAGSQTRKAAPRPGSLSTRMVPPRTTSRRCTMCSPRPTPF